MLPIKEKKKKKKNDNNRIQNFQKQEIHGAPQISRQIAKAYIADSFIHGTLEDIYNENMPVLA